MQKDTTQIYPLGPATVTLGSGSIGFCKTPKLSLSFKQTMATVAEYGDTPVAAFEHAVAAKLTAVIPQVDKATYQKVLGLTSYLTGSPDALGIGKVAGSPITGLQLNIDPIQTGVATLGALVLWSVVPTTDGNDIEWSEKTQELKVSFQALAVHSKPDGQKLGIFGNASATADATAPTLSSTSPVDDSTGQSVSAALTATFSEAMDPNFANSDNVQLFTTPVASGVSAKVAGAVTINAAGTIITFTPTSNLSATTQYGFVLGSGLRDISGNRFAGKMVNFTTT